jgi:organic hydroperoxide reductase OsmC/OhrA
MTDEALSVELVLQEDYRFEIDFRLPGVPLLSADLPPPLGKGAGPDPEKLLAAAVGNCLSASLQFALRKLKNETVPMRTVVEVKLARNEQNRQRVGRIEVEIRVGVAAAALKQLDRALAQFEDFCVVTQSVRAAIPVHVRVLDGEGVVLVA